MSIKTWKLFENHENVEFFLIIWGKLSELEPDKNGPSPQHWKKHTNSIDRQSISISNFILQNIRFLTKFYRNYLTIIWWLFHVLRIFNEGRGKYRNINTGSGTCFNWTIHIPTANWKTANQNLLLQKWPIKWSRKGNDAMKNVLPNKSLKTKIPGKVTLWSLLNKSLKNKIPGKVTL
jgi:hypothetical protein